MASRLGGFAVLLGLASAPPAHADPARAGIDAGNRAFVERFLAGDAAGAAALYTENARVIAPGAPVAQGSQAIAAFWAGARKDTSSVRLETLHVESQGDLALEEGVVHLTGTDGKTRTERYIVVWKRVGGRWLLHRDIWNAGPAAAP